MLEFGEILILNIIKQGQGRDPDIFPFHGLAIKSFFFLAEQHTV
jgi:hypothetical protein